MTRWKLGLWALGALVCICLLPTTAHAQSAIAGTVKDTSGAVLPGVQVEAASAVLIEKTRAVVTDSQGEYKIVDLRPGAYMVTFSLQGFTTFKREGLELPSNFTATINAEMKVGALEESVTVAGASPVVDVQSNTKTQVLSRDVLDSVPSAKTIQSLGQLVVGVTLSTPDVGGSRAMQQAYFAVHGSGASGSMVTVDGLVTNGTMGDGAVMAYHNEAMIQEAVYQTAGVSDEKMANPIVRATWQVSPRNKFAAYMDRALRLRGHAMNSLTDPATGSVVWHTPTFSTGSAKWTSTVSSKLLVEGGFSYNRERYDNVYQDGLSQPYGSAAWYAGASRRDNSNRLLWAAPSAQLGNYPAEYNVMAAVSYVTGSHNVKGGFQDAWGPYLRWNTANADLYQIYNGGAPLQVTLLNTPLQTAEYLDANLGLYVQDSWHVNRFTVNAGLRYDFVRQ